MIAVWSQETCPTCNGVYRGLMLTTCHVCDRGKVCTPTFYTGQFGYKSSGPPQLVEAISNGKLTDLPGCSEPRS